MRREPIVTLPQPLPHQLEVLCDPSRNKVVVCGRRWGKTVAGLLACLEGHGPRARGFRGALEGATVWWVAPTFAVASAVWRDLKAALRGAWTEKNEQERRIVLPGGGSVAVKSADAPDSLRGVGLDGVVFDEAAHAPEEAWSECLRPALADRQGWAIFISTPKGQNWFHDLFAKAEKRAGWARWQRPTSDNPRVPAAELEAARTELGTHVFAQEFLAEFVTPGGGLMHEEWINFFDERGTDVVLGDLERVHVDALSPRFAVCDLAVSLKTSADATCVLACGVTPSKRLVVLDAIWDRVEAPALVPKLRSLVHRWQLGAVHVETVGYQLAFVQAARDAGLPVLELRPTKDKVTRFMPLCALAERGGFWLPRAAAWTTDAVAEMTAFPHGAHDDFCDAAAYAADVAAGTGEKYGILDWG